MFQGLDAQRLVALFVAGLALFNFPLLALWDHDARVLGLPLFPAALLLIAALAWIVERSGDAAPTDGGPP
jgi:ABC-type cobalamin transport system permease subunit